MAQVLASKNQSDLPKALSRKSAACKAKDRRSVERAAKEAMLAELRAARERVRKVLKKARAEKKVEAKRQLRLKRKVAASLSAADIRKVVRMKAFGAPMSTPNCI
jgi:predicted RNA-binding Zn ribbon-like protein